MFWYIIVISCSVSFQSIKEKMRMGMLIFAQFFWPGLDRSLAAGDARLACGLIWLPFQCALWSMLLLAGERQSWYEDKNCWLHRHGERENLVGRLPFLANVVKRCFAVL